MRGGHSKSESARVESKSKRDQQEFGARARMDDKSRERLGKLEGISRFVNVQPLQDRVRGGIKSFRTGIHGLVSLSANGR